VFMHTTVCVCVLCMCVCLCNERGWVEALGERRVRKRDTSHQLMSSDTSHEVIRDMR
jgi:hypothetical protein